MKSERQLWAIVIALGLSVAAALSVKIAVEPGADRTSQTGRVADRPSNSTEENEIGRPIVLPDARISEEGKVPSLAPSDSSLVVIAGRILTTGAQGIPGARIDLVETAGTTRSAISDAGGFFEFGVPRGLGRIKLQLRPEGLPVGALVPWKQESCRLEETPAYLHSACIDITDHDGPYDVIMLVFFGGSISGLVVGPMGEPVAECFVRLQSTMSGAEALCLDTSTDEFGRYWFEHAYPSTYRIRVVPSQESDYHVLPRPSAYVSAAEGQAIDAPTMQFELGPGRISGRVIDQDGKPVPGIAIVCYENPGTWTDAVVIGGTAEDGSFFFDNLPLRNVAIAIGASGYRGYRDLFLLRPVDPIYIDLAASSSADLGSVEVERERPFAVQGKLEIDGSYAPYATNRSFGLSVVYFDGANDREDRVMIGPSMEFSWRGVAVGTATFVLSYGGTSNAHAPSAVRERRAVRFPIAATPDKTEELVLRFQ